jgi:protein-tyrosine phosphatase
MLPLIDTHCHLLAGLDDGPEDMDQAIEMCQMADQDGVRAVLAVAHQNPHWPKATRDRILSGARDLQQRLIAAEIQLQIRACGEVMIGPDLMDDWRSGELVEVGEVSRYLLLEMPHGLLLDIGTLITELVNEGVRPILAHPERYRELWYQPSLIVDWIRRGCLMQACADGILSRDPQLRRHLQQWIARDWIHLVASDGHSLTTRPPQLAEARAQLVRWTNLGVAQRLTYDHPLAIFEGQRLIVPQPQPPKRRWSLR